MLTTLKHHKIILDDGRVNPAYVRLLNKNPALVQEIHSTTAFLIQLENAKHDLYQRVVCIREGITQCPSCTVCGTKLKYKFSRKYFGEFCSAKCAGPSANARSRATMVARYGHATPLHVPHIREKHQATLVERYGQPSFTSTDTFKEKTKHTLARVYGTTSISHRNMSSDVLSSTYDVALLQQLNKTLNLKHIAEYLGVSPSLIQKRFAELNIVPVKHDISGPQRQIEEFIAAELPGVVVMRNHVGLFDDKREVDIYIPSKSIAIEVNGVHWHSEHNGRKPRLYHNSKTVDLQTRGVRLVHITDTEWIINREVTESRIRSLLGVTPRRIGARQCELRLIDTQTRREFFDAVHIQRDTAASVCYGLYFDNELVAAMSFGRPRFSDRHDYELIRFANALNTTVVGGASRLFSHFIRTHTPGSIVSYSDRRWNIGTVYQQIGMTYVRTSAPNYWYFRVGHTNKLFSRARFQKHKLTNMLSYNADRTEWDIMRDEGYDRIWDCGNDVFEWTNRYNSL